MKDMLAEFEIGDKEIKNVLFRSLSHFNGPYMLDLRYNDALKALATDNTGNKAGAQKKGMTKEH